MKVTHERSNTTTHLGFEEGDFHRRRDPAIGFVLLSRGHGDSIASGINAGLAQGKGRSGLAWWVVSLLLGPVATFLVVVLDPVKPQ